MDALRSLDVGVGEARREARRERMMAPSCSFVER
jgi:hypothetical protein